MVLLKIANSEIVFREENAIPAEQALSSPEITNRFTKIAQELKKVAPRSGDFLYFIARAIHSMEHSAIDPVTRQYDPKIGHIAYNNGSGICKTCGCELHRTNNTPISGLWCSSSQVDPWINQNGDAFPESELLAEIEDMQNPGKKIRAYQTFINKGLFTDHKSSEVENIRGIILDAEYDHSTKGVDLLIALDKKAYPELARQITAGYSAQVSMGTQVNYSLCSICGNKAITENDYCSHVRNDKAVIRAGAPRCYEVNNGLSFIEISMVGNAADPRARIRTIVAHVNDIKEKIQADLDSNVQESENRLILDSINRLECQVNDLKAHVEDHPAETQLEDKYSASKILNKISELEKQIKEIGGRFMAQKKTDKKAYFQGTVEPEVGKPFEMADKNYMQYWDDDIKQTGPDQTNGPEGMHGGYGLGSDEDVHKMYQRASAEQRKAIRKALLDKVSYFQGTVEPELGKPFEMADKNYMQYWDDDIKQSGPDQTNGSEGTHGGYGLGPDEQVKKELFRAKLKAKLEKFANSAKNKWTIYAMNEETGETTKVLEAVAEECYGSELDAVAAGVDDGMTYQDWFNHKNYGINLIQALKRKGLEAVASKIAEAKQRNLMTKKAQEMPAAPMPEAPAAEMPAEPMPDEAGMAPEAPEMSATESIKAAADRIESAKDEILSMVEEMEGGPKAEGEELGADMGAAGEELGELGAEMGDLAEMPATAARNLKKLTRYALFNADQVLKKAEQFVSKYAKEDDEDEDEEKDGEGEVEIKVEDADKDDVEVKESMTKKRLQARKEARRTYAQQLYNLTDGDMIAEAHPEGGNVTTFPGQEQGRIETETEAQEADLDVVNTTPRGELTARQQRRHRLLKAAQKVLLATDAAQVAQKATEAEQAQKSADEKKKELAETVKTEAGVKTAEVDKETKQYYNELAAPGDPEVKKFYSEMTQDFGKKKSTAAAHDYGLKIKRAFAVAMKRAQLGQIESTQEAIEADVDRLVNLDDQSFSAFADVVENTKKANVITEKKSQVKTAGALKVGYDQEPQTAYSGLGKLPWS